MFCSDRIGFMYKNCIRFLLFALFVPAAVLFPLKLAAEDFTSLHINFDAALSENNVSGAGSDRSFVSEGWKYTGIMNTDLHGEYDDLRFNLRFGLRATNDKRSDYIPLSLTNAQGFIENKEHKLILGDVFEVFSRYSLSSSLKGANYRYEKKGLPAVSLIGGRAYPRWESWWKDPDAVMLKREVYGANIKHQILDDFNFGISYLQSSDSDPAFQTETLYSNKVLAAVADYKPLPGLTLTGETALSSTDLKNGAAASEAGQAYRFEAVGDQDPSRVVLEYERVSPDFESLVGSAVRDRESAGGSWRYKATGDVTVNTSMKWHRNSLDSKALRTNTYRPAAGVNIRRLGGRRYSNLDLKLKMDYRDAPSRVSSDWFASADYRDRIGLYDMDAGLGFSSYNAGKKDSDQLDTTARFSVSTRRTVGDMVLNPALSASAGYVDDDQADIIRKVYEYSASLGLSLPEKNLSSNLRIGQNFMRVPDADADAVYVSAQVNYSPRCMRGGRLYLKFSLNDYSYQATGNDYTERIVTAGLNLPLDYRW